VNYARLLYGQNVMSEGTVQWCRMFKDGRTYVYDEERSGWPSVMSDDLVQDIDQKVCERRRFTIAELSCEFPQISRTVLYEITTGHAITSSAQDGFRKCSRVRTERSEWLRLL
jgi:hypothetical protein